MNKKSPTNQNLFAGWRQVFSFTFKESIKVKSFKLITILLSILILSIGILSNVLPAALSSDSDGADVCPAETVYIYNETDIPVDFSAMTESDSYYEKIRFTTSEKEKTDLLRELSNPDGYDAVLSITKADEGYSLSLTLPEESGLFPDECSTLLNDAILHFQSVILNNSGISADAARIASMSVDSYSYFDGEEDDSFGQAMLEMLFPMLFILVLYIMIILYGQSVAKSVISEKSSKLMEFLLVTIKPYGLIAGKILATFCVAILQFILWLACGIGGFLLGDLIAGNLFPDYNNFLLTILKFMSDNGVFAFTPAAIILSIVGIALAFLFYCSLAGAVSSSITSTENLSSGMSLFMLPVVISFLATYMASMYSNETLLTVLQFVPFTAAFLVPSHILIGSIPIGEGILSLLALALCTVLMMLLTGKLYKARVFYRGKGLRPKLGLFKISVKH